MTSNGSCPRSSWKRICSSMRGNTQWQSVICTAHWLQTALKHALDGQERETLIKAQHKMVGHLAHSTKATNACLNGCTKEQEDLQTPIQDIGTHFISTKYMLTRLV